MANDYKQNQKYETITGRNTEGTQEPPSLSQNKYSLPYGLCAKYGVYLPNGATPTDAWNALKGIGIKPSEVYKDLQSDGKVDIQPTGKKVVESKKKTKELLNENKPVDVNQLSKEEKTDLLYKFNVHKFGDAIADKSTYPVDLAAEIFDEHYGTNEEMTMFINKELGIGAKSTENSTESVTKSSKLAGSTHNMAGDAYTEERYANALNSEDPQVYDDMARAKTFSTWKNLSYEERYATVDYTGGYSKYNEPLRGIEYGTSKFVGEGNIDMETIGMSYGGYKKGEIKKRIDAFTSAIEKSSYDKDVILRRGTGYSGMDNFFKGVDIDTLKTGSQAELENALVGNTYTDGAFMSCGSSKGKGFSGDIKFSIYAPKGTKMLYVEPVSDYGAKYGIDWKGEKQTHFNSENETVIQRGSSFRVTQVKRLPDGKLYVRMEVVAQKSFS